MDASASAPHNSKAPAPTTPATPAAADSVHRHDPDRGDFYARYLVVVIIDRTRRLPKRLVSVHAADTFDSVCKARLEEDMGLQVQPTSVLKVGSMACNFTLAPTSAEHHF